MSEQLIAFDLIGYEGDQWIRVIGGRTLYESVLVRDGYTDGSVRLTRIVVDQDGIRQLNRYVDPETAVELVTKGDL
jgi:hypothetical protein